MTSPIQTRLPKSRGNDGRTGCLSLIRPSCAGSSAMVQNPKSGETASLAKFADRGASTRPVANQAALDISLPRRGQNRKDRGFPPSRQARWFRWVFKNEGGDRRARSRSRAIKLRVGLLVRFSNCTARGDYDQQHRTHASPQERSLRPEQTRNLRKKPRPRFGARRSAP